MITQSFRYVWRCILKYTVWGRISLSGGAPCGYALIMHVQEALVLVSAVAAHNNEHIKKQQSQLKIVEIQKALDTYGPVHVSVFLPRPLILPSLTNASSIPDQSLR